MIELIRSWLFGITCASAIVALAEGLTPSGAVRKVGKIAGGLVLLLAIVKPIATLDMGDFAAILSEYRIDASVSAMDMGSENTRIMKHIIEEETGAYILDKAKALGIQCRVEVTAVAGEEDGDLPIPDAVTITGNLSPGQQAALTRRIEADLAIPEARQVYQRGEVE